MAVASRAVRLALAVVTALLAATVPAAADPAAAQRPARDPFYRYTGATPLARIAPGTPLRTRSATLGADTATTPLPATQVLYRTTDASGRATTSVTTVVLPASGTSAPRVVAYLSMYDALDGKCSPSYTLRGGDPDPANRWLADLEQGLVATLHAQGYVVTVPDFEDAALSFAAGTESGMSTLDAVRATLSVLRLAAGTPVGLAGYSGGAIAAGWASELAPRYAPALHLVGTALGGVPVNLPNVARYVEGDPTWSPLIPAALLGIARGYRIGLDPYLSEWGQEMVATVATECIGEMQGQATVTLARLMKPRYADVFAVPVFRRVFAELTLGARRPAAPLLLVWGNADGRGDGVTVAADQAALAARYCAKGVAVRATELTGLDHTAAGTAFFAQAFPWLGSRFAGAPAPSTCR